MAVEPVREIAIAGDVRAPATRALVNAVLERFDPNRVLAWGPPDSVPLLADRPLVEGGPAAYVCEHFVCAAPVTNVDALLQLLSANPVRTG
jgi:uncharacterized protein YyaL (SSP411 family)